MNDDKEILHFDEANVARLGLISIQERIPDHYTSWSLDFEMDGRRARLSCVGVQEHGGVPHGLDNDVTLALITLFQEAGSPDDGTIVASAYRILTSMGWDTSGHYYNALRESLDRLTTATFTASEAWRTGKKWTTVRFRYIDRLEYTSDDEKLGLSGHSVVKIRLAREIVDSIRSKYLKPLDLEFLTSLDRPLTRSLYRLLDAQRVSMDREELTQFRTGIINWAKACKIVDITPSRVRRTLEGAHRELVERGYLSSVSYKGRGLKQEIIYSFSQQGTVSQDGQKVLVGLARYGVARPVAQNLINTFGLQRVVDRLARFEAILAAGYSPRNKAGFLVDIVRDDEGKYGDSGALATNIQHAKAQAATAKRKEAERLAEERAQQITDAEWEALDATGRAAKAVRILSLTLGKHLPLRYFSGLSEAFEAGVMDPRSVVEAAVKAFTEAQVGPFVESLKQVLDNSVSK
jgi:plasmid replication initiation protein